MTTIINGENPERNKGNTEVDDALLLANRTRKEAASIGLNCRECDRRYKRVSECLMHSTL